MSNKTPNDDISNPSISLPSPPTAHGLQRDSVRDVPKFRSIMVAKPMCSIAPPGPPIGLSPPPLRMRTPKLMREKSSDRKMEHIVNERAMRKEKLTHPLPHDHDVATLEENSEGPTWNVPNSMVHPLPLDYDVATTSRFIDGVEANVISNRLAHLFKKSSVIAAYDPEKAKARCVTRDFSKFQVRMHRGRGKYSNGIILEVLRRSGPRMEFLKDCNAIFLAAESYEDCDSDASWAPNMRRPVTEMKCLEQAHELHATPISRMVEALESVQRLLKDERDDANVMGMEYLCSFDFKNGHCANTCRQVGMGVLFGMNYPLIHEKIIHYLKEDENVEVHRKNTVTKLRNLALVAVHNALWTLVYKACAPNAIEGALCQCRWLRDDLFIELFNGMRNMDICPQNSLVAVKSMNLLICNSKSMKEKAVEIGAEALFQKGKELGSKYCSCMESECNIGLEALR